MEEKKKRDVAIVYLRDGLVIKESRLSFSLSVIMRLLCGKKNKKKEEERKKISLEQTQIQSQSAPSHHNKSLISVEARCILWISFETISAAVSAQAKIY